MRQPKLVVLLGTDGSGKSTILNQLSQTDLQIVGTHWKKLNADNLNLVNPDEDLIALRDFERFNYLKRYFELELKNIKTLLRNGSNVLADGFYIKFLLKEKLFNKLDIKLFQKINPFDGKETYIFLDTNVEDTYKRKDKITKYECYNDKTDFVRFQTDLRNEMCIYLKDKPHFTINGNQDKIDVFNELYKILQIVLL